MSHDSRDVRVSRSFIRRSFSVLLLFVASSSFMAAPKGASATGDVIINERDLVRLPKGVLAARPAALPERDISSPIISAARKDQAASLLRQLDASGRATGFAGVLYDNRDRLHSDLDPELFPRLSRVRYGFELIAGNADYGLAGNILLPGVVFGNSSTAITHGPAPRSLSRFAMTDREQARAQSRLYASNHIYVYPEHRDHDGVDLFPANWPYTLTSQGSSGSDQPVLEAIAMTLAAFPPPTFERLENEGLVAPTLQMILRQNLSNVSTRNDYLSGAAHPVVFDAALLQPARMVAAASRLRPEEIPPVVRLDVLAEDFRTAAGLAALDERLFDSPSAIARIWRDLAWEREMIVSAKETSDPNGRPLKFAWKLLQGDPERIDIEQLDSSGRSARLRVRWHDAFLARGPGSGRVTSRIDIGVFASNGVNDSAPAIISISFPTHQIRTYSPGPDGVVRLTSVDYDAEARNDRFDPVLHWTAAWKDEPVRDPTQTVVAWTRTGRNGKATTVPVDRDAFLLPSGYRIDRSVPDRPRLVPLP